MSQEGVTLSQSPRQTAFVNFNDAVRTVLQSRDVRGQGSHVTLTADLAADLPPVSVSHDQLEHVISRLLSNAEQAIEGDLGRPGLIQMRTAVEDGRLHFLVIDNGRGIHSRDMAGLFKGQGRYVDLTACAEIVSDHGGELYAWSSFGKGSVFTMELPVSDPMHEGLRASSRVHQVLRGRRILVIDDEIHVMGLMSDILGMQGAVIDRANSGFEAIQRIKSNPYDLLICDQHMPGMSGENLYWSVHSENPELRERFLFVTGDVEIDDTTGFFAQAGVPYIQKPFRTVELVSAAEQVINQSPQLSS
jgi:CheY-like chemotaxis protein